MDNNKEDIKEFVRFLKDTKVYSRYRNNLLKHAIGNINPFNLPLQFDYSDFIIHTFKWTDTKEGYEFWLKIHKFWLFYHWNLNGLKPINYGLTQKKEWYG